MARAKRLVIVAVNVHVAQIIDIRHGQLMAERSVVLSPRRGSMVQALPIHIISEIERRWLRRLDAQLQLKPDNQVKPGNDEGNTGRCPLRDVPESI